MKLLFALMAIFSFLSQMAQAELQLEVLYGPDNRHHIEESPAPNFKILSLSTAMMIHEDKIESAFDGVLTKIYTEKLGPAYYLCSEERYHNEIIAGKCSGFLVGPDLLVTAGHCITGESSCKNNKWVFDFRNDLILDSGEKDSVYVGSNNVYGCKEVINRKYSTESKNDFALIRLDRPVLDRSPLRFRTEGKIEVDAQLVMIGHPLGLSSKISYKANILKNDNPFFFKTNLDSFLGNSGSAVFNKITGIVEGILVRGELDFEQHDEMDCEVVKVCSEDGEDCKGEDVTRITVIPELVPGMTPNEPEIDPFLWDDDLDTDDIISEDDESIDWDCYFSDDEDCDID
ncbi:MAG: serine protease [Deltaproteobacteria bacterium]|nr:MAG: serine protease [Deltaproteobacteria bacterium]